MNYAKPMTNFFHFLLYDNDRGNNEFWHWTKETHNDFKTDVGRK